MQSPPKLEITQVVLKELEQIAITTPLPHVDKLSYSNGQSAMTINALIKWMESYGLEAPFKLDI